MVDRSLILRKLSELEECIEQIKEYSNITVDEYSNNWKIQRIVERTLQLMIENCVDIASHIISDRRYRIPQSYADTFSILHKEGILEKKLFDTMEKMAKFRNIVVHHYDKVDAVIVVNILKRYIGDFLNYRNAIVDILKENGKTKR
ncbi:MAG: DUF86 domain-containing protein [Candidatus Desulfaltia sp.]|nr:DUF86 domain-containing protein [Candidatus Desulfaltia sp.]